MKITKEQDIKFYPLNMIHLLKIKNQHLLKKQFFRVGNEVNSTRINHKFGKTIY